MNGPSLTIVTGNNVVTSLLILCHISNKVVIRIKYHRSAIWSGDGHRVVLCTLVGLSDLYLVQRDSLILAINGDNQVALAVSGDLGDSTRSINHTVNFGAIIADQRVGTILVITHLLNDCIFNTRLRRLRLWRLWSFITRKQCGYRRDVGCLEINEPRHRVFIGCNAINLIPYRNIMTQHHRIIFHCFIRY